METNPEHFAGAVAHKAFIEKDGKILLCKAPGEDIWDIPGGRIHKGENPLDAVKREVAEELGVEIEVEKPFFVGLTKATYTGEERYFVGFKATFKDPSKLFLFQPEEVSEIYWVKKEEIETISVHEVCREALRAYFSL